jgi:hypothetical protein
MQMKWTKRPLVHNDRYSINFFTNYSSKELPPQLADTSQLHLVTLPHSPHTTRNKYRDTFYSAFCPSAKRSTAGPANPSPATLRPNSLFSTSSPIRPTVKGDPEPLLLPDARTNAKISFHSNKRYQQASNIHYLHQAYLKLAIMLQVHRTEREPPMISKYLVVCQEKSTNTGLVWPLVVKILFVVHLLDFPLQNQPIPNADVPIP